jgi:hypothetical protein
MSESEEQKLLALGRELSERLQDGSDPRAGEALFRARQRALQQFAAATRRAPDYGRWLPTAVAAGVATLGIVLVLQLWNGAELRPDAEDRGAFVMQTFAADEAPWDEDPDMLENMDFTLWLDMAGPEDEG